MEEKILSEILKRLEKIEQALSLDGSPDSEAAAKTKRKVSKESSSELPEKFNFSQNIRAFMKKFGKDLSGPKKFTLLAAYLLKGSTKDKIVAEEIKSKWNQLSGVMGGKITTGIYGTRAKENGWLDSPKNGEYILTDSWKEIFS